MYSNWLWSLRPALWGSVQSQTKIKILIALRVCVLLSTPHTINYSLIFDKVSEL